MTEAKACEQLAQSRYAAVPDRPAGSQIRNLSTERPTLSLCRPDRMHAIKIVHV